MKKKNSINPFLWLPALLLLLCGYPLLAQQTARPQADTAMAAQAVGAQAPAWQQRQFSEQTLAELADDRHMDYALAQADEGVWERFKRWLAYKLSQLLSGANTSGLLEVFFYLFCIAAGLFIVVRFLDIDLSTLLHRKAAAAPITVPQGITEDIHELNFEAEIARAIAAREYPRAIRLLYLSALKRLADGGHIRWEPGKTNHQYQQEMPTGAMGRHFARLGYYFEWAWYGDFPVDETTFAQARQEWELFCKTEGVQA